MQTLGTLFLSPEHLKSWYVYSVESAAGGPVLYLGYNNLAAITSFQSLMGNPAFKRNDVYKVIIHSVHADQISAHNAAVKLIPEKQPALNLTERYNRYMPVVCVTTGQRFRNAAEACRMLGIPSPRMSNHLAGKAGHKTIKGLSFRFATFYDGLIQKQTESK
jgi:hypothetical protein